jgi:ferredoxin
MVIDTRKCVGCMDCVAACKTENGVGPERFGGGTHPFATLSVAFENVIGCKILVHAYYPPLSFNFRFKRQTRNFVDLALVVEAYENIAQNTEENRDEDH